MAHCCKESCTEQKVSQVTHRTVHSSADANCPNGRPSAVSSTTGHWEDTAPQLVLTTHDNDNTFANSSLVLSTFYSLGRTRAPIHI